MGTAFLAIGITFFQQRLDVYGQKSDPLLASTFAFYKICEFGNNDSN